MAQPPTIADLLAAATRSAVHLEMRDGYGLGNPAFVAWQQGSLPKPEDNASWTWWRDLVGAATQRGVSVRRARIVGEPLSEYVRFEYDVTPVLNLPAGEDVRWLPRNRASDLALPGNDFWIFDDQVVLFYLFTGDGEPAGHEFRDEPEVTKLCQTAFAQVWERAIPHQDYRP